MNSSEKCLRVGYRIIVQLSADPFVYELLKILFIPDGTDDNTLLNGPSISLLYQAFSDFSALGWARSWRVGLSKKDH